MYCINKLYKLTNYKKYIMFLFFVTFLIITILTLVILICYKSNLSKKYIIRFFITCLVIVPFNPLVFLVLYFFIKLLSIKVLCNDWPDLFEQFLHDLFNDHLMIEQYQDDGVKSLPMAAVKCPKCLEKRDDTVWLLQGEKLS